MGLFNCKPSYDGGIFDGTVIVESSGRSHIPGEDTDYDDDELTMVTSEYQNLRIRSESESKQRVRKNDHLLRLLMRDLQVPPQYQDYNLGKAYSLQLLPESSRLYQSVTNCVSHWKFNRQYRIKRIYEIWNPYLYLQYRLAKEYLGDRFHERDMFHGTSQSSAKAIMTENFDWRKVVNKKFGQGVSFGSDSWYASHYSFYHREGYSDCYVMILAKVLVERGPLKEGTYATIVPQDGCTTTRNRTGQVIVKYDDSLFYPAYIVYFEPKT